MPKNKPIWVLGLMSGTSLDGVDGAAILTDGVDILDIGPTKYRPYGEEERAVLRSALGKWPGDPGLDQVNALVLAAHMQVIREFPDVDAIGFHGQTLAHDPGGRGTHQIGDGAHLAAQAGKPVVWDFRSNDVAMGGQGAPLAPIYHWAMVRQAGVIAPVVILNLGGVGNLTYVDPNLPPDQGVLAFDTGPANAPLDDFLWQRCGQKFDKDAALASRGTADQSIISQFLDHPYFDTIPPKSLDRDAFDGLGTAVAGLSDCDGAATLTRAMVAGVVAGFNHMPQLPTQLWVAGGGRLNPLVMSILARDLDVDVIKVE
ncbi:MAG: anhydro-N-acetylmuramic acid kinase, partial [Planktomarina sp.]